MRTHLHYHNNLSGLKTLVSPETSIVIFDRKLLTKVDGFHRWIGRFPHAYPVLAGEKTKSLAAFSSLCERIHGDVGESVTRSWTVVAIGGGSVGDFAGFFASVYRRGLRLVHVPTTWLSAFDSSHGGKTALNLAGAKNQIGSFYPASDTVLIRSVLQALPASSIEDARGELVKIALIDGRAWARKLNSRSLRAANGLWLILPDAIEAKLRIVRRDPLELKGERQLLNLGHTMGHVFEAELGISHGQSVGLGLLFALDLSERLGAISIKSTAALRGRLTELGITRDALRFRKSGFQVSAASARRLLCLDKKREAGDFVSFIVIRGFGRVERRLIAISQILEVAEDAGWLK